MGSYFAMAFFPSFDNQYCVRNLKLRGFKTEKAARQAIERAKLDGYVKKLGQSVPVWSNVK